MKFIRRIQYQCDTSIGESKINESLDIEDTFELEVQEHPPTQMFSLDQVALHLIQELKKEGPCVELESSSTE